MTVIEAIPMPVEPIDYHHPLSTPQAVPRPMTPMSLPMGSPHTFGSDSAKRKRSDGSRLAPVEIHEQTGSYMSPQSVHAPSPSKDQGRPLVHPLKKPRHGASLDPDTEMSNVRAEPHLWARNYDHPLSNANIGSPESMSPVRSPDPGNEMDLDVSAKERESNPSPHQQRYLPPPPPQLQQQVSPPPQQIQQQQGDPPLKPHTISTLPTGSNSHTWTEEDKNLIEQLRSRMSKNPGYNEFLESRNKQLTMREQLKHYAYIKNQLEEYAHGGLNAKKMHVMGVFNLPESWGDMALETLQLFALYGPEGSEFEDGRIIDMMDETPPITGKIQASKFLDRLRQRHREQNDD
ncbi:hypothetical protein BDM02DRAFT_1169608 [Thelephora ganbajun]|uniref:Uncharacterized protein n=1 Tax=Thelephora ganbajun TaxID=370292 RepID=A0ACB6ZWS0_THEGA|nr:hypothetical protein BDM02DRAFT_1169608 [Thelephora ganbajun]